MIRRVAVVFFLIFMCEPLCAEERQENAILDDNTVLVIGRRREKHRENRAGKSLSVTPELETRFDTSVQLKQEPSLNIRETGRISPSGFVVPSVRGQETRLTEVFLEDICVQNPYTGLPLVDDVDLRAFGTLEVYQGLSATKIPSVNPFGTLRYRIKRVKKDEKMVGFEFGKPYGLSLFGAVRAKRELSYQIYGRTHHTDGEYKYYGDGGTPYNEEDDKYLTRENNDQRSSLFMPYLSYQMGRHKIGFFDIRSERERGIPARSQNTKSLVRERSSSNIGVLSLKSVFTENESSALPYSTNVSLSRTDQNRRVEDDRSIVLFGSNKTEFEVEANQADLKLDWESDTLSASLYSSLALSGVNYRVDDEEAFDMTRRTKLGYLGLAFRPLDFVELEAKGELRRHEDEDEALQRSSEARSGGVGAFFQYSVVSPYIQFAWTKRLPSLLEEFGNGGVVLANVELEAEQVKHREAGFVLGSSQDSWLFSGAFFEDFTENKIVFVPATLDTLKATNLRTTKVQGVDVNVDYFLSATDFHVGASRVLPANKTVADREKLIPGIPERVATASVVQHLGHYSLRWAARYRSEVFRDSSNSVRVPGVTIHDLSVDNSCRISGVDVRSGLSVLNLFDTTKLEVEGGSEGSAGYNKGYTSYSDTAGYPLPGRQLKLSMSATW